VPQGEGHATYWYFAIALLGSAMTPHEVFFFSSGAVEEGWKRSDLLVSRANVLIGFPLGGLLALGLMFTAAIVLEPGGVDAAHLSQVALPVSLTLGKLGLALVLIGRVRLHLRRRPGDRAVVRLYDRREWLTASRSISAGSASSCGRRRPPASTWC
jgi:Natural resistance-associated macrophage protein